jgi:hypothetical protein
MTNIFNKSANVLKKIYRNYLIYPKNKVKRRGKIISFVYNDIYLEFLGKYNHRLLNDFFELDWAETEALINKRKNNKNDFIS